MTYEELIRREAGYLAEEADKFAATFEKKFATLAETHLERTLLAMFTNQIKKYRAVVQEAKDFDGT